jgi:hypothetical protein
MAFISLGLMATCRFLSMHHVQKWVEKIRVVESAQGFMSLKELVAEGFVALRRRQFQMIAGKGSKLSSLKTTSSPFSSR